jgi:hypothetical protein
LNKSVEKTCECKSFSYCKKIEEELNSLLKGNVEKESRKKRPTITNVFVTKDPFKKDEVQQKQIERPWPLNC